MSVREAGAMLSMELEKVRQLLVDHAAGVSPASFADRRDAAIGRIEYLLSCYRNALADDGWREALTNCLALVELKYGNTDETACAVINQARAILGLPPLPPPPESA